MPLTNGEIEIIKTLGAPLLGAPIGAIIALVAARRTSNASTATQTAISASELEARRELARDERLWKERSALYAEAAQAIAKLPDLGFTQDFKYQPSFDFVTAYKEHSERLKALSGRFMNLAEKPTAKFWGTYSGGYSTLYYQSETFMRKREAYIDVGPTGAHFNPDIIKVAAEVAQNAFKAVTTNQSALLGARNELALSMRNDLGVE